MDCMVGALQPGDRVAGRYLIVDEIGVGGFGVVYLAVQESIQRYVALKTIQPQEDAFQASLRAREFHREALHTSRLRHPNTIILHDYGQTPQGLLYLVTEYLEGEDLANLMVRSARLMPSLALRLMRQVAGSLAEAHEVGIVHGDLKPENVFLCEGWSQGYHVKVLDFGIARMIGDANPAGMGTPRYMAPEQFSGEPLLPATDVYACGLMLYEMIMGQGALGSLSQLPRHTRDSPALPELPPIMEAMGWGSALRRALDPDPQRRYAHGGELLRALRALDEAMERLGDGTWDGPPPVSSLIPEAARLGWEGATHSLQGEEDPSTGDAALMRQTQQGPLGSHRSLRARARHGAGGLLSGQGVVGRLEERAALRRALDQAAQRHAGAVVLLGAERGLGKATLGQWALDQARELHLRRAEGHYLPQQCALQRALGAALGCLPDEQGAYHMRSLEDGAAAWLGRDLHPEETVTLMAAFGWYQEANLERLHRGILGLILEMARVRPLFLLLHHLELASPASLRLLEALVGSPELQRAPLLILGTVCRDLLPENEEAAQALFALMERDHVSLLHLRPPDQASQVMLARLAMEAALEREGLRGLASAQLLADLVRAACGNPGALQELVAHVVQEELLVPTSAGFVLKREVDPDHLMPPALASFLEQRVLARLDRHPERHLLQLLVLRCAMLGEEFSQELLADVLQREEGVGHRRAREVRLHLAELLLRLTREDILQANTSGGISWRFCQPLVHRLLLGLAERMPDAPILHAIVVASMDAIYPLEQRGLVARCITDHHVRAGRPGAPTAPRGWSYHDACWWSPQGQP